MTSKIVATETPVTDYLYDEAKANLELRDSFLQYIKPERSPRKGENILLSAEDWEQKLLSFAREKDMYIDPIISVDQQAVNIRNKIFGEPITIEAGGALANTFDTLVKASINGHTLVDGVFITAIGEGISGEVFANSLSGKLVNPLHKVGKWRRIFCQLMMIASSLLYQAL